MAACLRMTPTWHCWWSTHSNRTKASTQRLCTPHRSVSISRHVILCRLWIVLSRPMYIFFHESYQRICEKKTFNLHLWTSLLVRIVQVALTILGFLGLDTKALDASKQQAGVQTINILSGQISYSGWGLLRGVTLLWNVRTRIPERQRLRHSVIYIYKSIAVILQRWNAFNT